jgi:uncharacterized membrane protein
MRGGAPFGAVAGGAGGGRVHTHGVRAGRVARSAVFALALAVAACGGRSSSPVPPAQEATAGPARLRGTLLVRTDSSLAFVACGTLVERAVVAPPASQLGAAITAVNGALRDSAWVEFTADTTRGSLTVRETLFATTLAEGSRCDRPRPLAEWEALGVEPFWHVTVDGTHLVLERPEPPRELVFDARPPESRGALTTIIATRALGKVHELKLGLLREACRDGMSDAWYPFRAEVRMGDVALHGCARR